MFSFGNDNTLALAEMTRKLQEFNIGFMGSSTSVYANPTRALNIARSSRNIAKLDLTSQIQAHNLVKFAQHAKYLGNGLAVIDFTSRIGNVRNEYKSGGNWERELFIESFSFAASAATSALVVQAGLSALGLIVLATPIGWVGVIVGGLVIAGSAAAGSIAMNNLIKNNSGNWHDAIMKGMNAL